MKRPLRNRLDNIIRERLEQLYPPYSPSHWAKLEEQLNKGILDEEVPADTPGASLQDLDAALFEKMHTYQATDKAKDHWPLMEQRLQQTFGWPQYILRYKSVELAAILLLFLGLWLWLPSHQAATVNAFHIPMKGGEAPNTSKKHTPSSTDYRQPQEQTYQSSLPKGAEAPRLTSDTPALSSLPYKETEAGTSLSNQAGSFPPSIALNTLPQAPLPSSLYSQTVKEKLPLFGLQPVATRLPGLESLLPIAQLEAKLLNYPTASLGEVRKLMEKPATKIRLGMFANGEYNHILVPASEDRGLRESFQRAAFGYGSGLSLDFDFGRVEIGTGLIYAARSYPVGLVYLEGSVSQGIEADELRTTELNIVSMPLHVRYDVIQKGKWRGYLLAGGAVQVAFQTNYFTAKAPEQFSFRPAVPVPSSPGDGGSGEEKAIDRIKQDGVGWFEGGSFEDNAYLTANLGFGVERFIAERWSLFAQPVYQHSFHYFKKIDGLGPNEDRINSLSILFGTRVRLR